MHENAQKYLENGPLLCAGVHHWRTVFSRWYAHIRLKAHPRFWAQIALGAPLSVIIAPRLPAYTYNKTITFTKIDVELRYECIDPCTSLYPLTRVVLWLERSAWKLIFIDWGSRSHLYPLVHTIRRSHVRKLMLSWDMNAFTSVPLPKQQLLSLTRLQVITPLVYTHSHIVPWVERSTSKPIVRLR